MEPILFVDDDSQERRFASDTLDIALPGIHVDYAENGQELVNKVRESMASGSEDHYRLIITDYSMPEMDGPQAVREIREMGYEGPVLLMSNATSNQRVRKALAAGATLYLDKGTETVSFCQKVRELYGLPDDFFSDKEDPLELLIKINAENKSYWDSF